MLQLTYLISEFMPFVRSVTKVRLFRPMRSNGVISYSVMHVITGMPVTQRILHEEPNRGSPVTALYPDPTC